MIRTPSLLLPPDEVERLHTLRAYDILHSLQEPLFNELVELTAHIFNVPISLLALVDADEVEYKAVQGLSGLRAQPRGEALCSLAVRQGKTVIITDLSCAKQDYLTASAQAAARAKGVQFYAGAPLRMPNQRCIGTLCVIDQQPRTFSLAEQQVLEQLAYLVGRLLAVRQYCLAGKTTGEERWPVVRAELAAEVRALVALVRYLTTRSGRHVPVLPIVLKSVTRHLDDLRWSLGDYYPGHI